MAEYYDLIVIGAGPGGYTAALKAAGFGMKTALVEERTLGGACVNRGCIPTKALLYASSCFGKMQQWDELGVSADFVSFDFKKMQQYKDRAVKACRDEIGRLLEQSGAVCVQGRGRILPGRTVEVEGPAGKRTLKGSRIIIASGAAGVVPEIPGAELPGVYTSSGLLEAKGWSFDRLTIVGGGVIGVEFAAIFCSLCAKVTLIEKGPHLLGPMDGIVARELEAGFRRKGITVLCGSSVSRIEERGGLCCLVTGPYGEETLVRSSSVLMAVGRKPNTEGLWADGVAVEKDGDRIAVDREFMTGEPEVYAIGDAASETQLAHAAAAQGTYVVERIAGRPHTVRLEVVPPGMSARLPIVPNCIYTEPEIATVGITQERAKAMGIPVICGHSSMNENGKSIITRREDGFIRLVFEAYTKALVGAQIVCPRATDMIGEMATAIANGLTAEQLSFAMRAHPTYSEGIAAAIADAMHPD